MLCTVTTYIVQYIHLMFVLKVRYYSHVGRVYDMFLVVSMSGHFYAEILYKFVRYYKTHRKQQQYILRESI